MIGPGSDKKGMSKRERGRLDTLNMMTSFLNMVNSEGPTIIYMCLTLYLYLCSMFMCLFKLAIKCDSIRLLLWRPAARPINIEDPITICGIRGGPCLDQRAPSNQTQIKVSTAIGKMLKEPAGLLNLIPHNIYNVAKRESPTNWWDKSTVHDCCGRLWFWHKYKNRSTETKSISCRGRRRGQAQ